MSAAATKSHESYEMELDQAYKAYAVRNPKSEKANSNASQYFPGGNTRSSLRAQPFPLVFESGYDTYLKSIDGDTYIDFLAEYSAGIFGHKHPVIRDAITKALDKGWNYGGHNTYEQELAQKVVERFKPTIELVRFTNSGTEANMCAIATAAALTGRKGVMIFDGGYHGSTIAFSKVYGPNALNLPHKWVQGVYDNVEKTKAILDGTDKSDLAAILVEPMQGNAGARKCSVKFLQFLRYLATEVGALLIFDEVQASRLSYRGYNQEIGVHPDMMTLGKWVGGGMSFGAFGGKREIMKMYDPEKGSLTHAGTFNNNVLSMAAGCAGIDLVDESAIANLNALGEYLKEGVEKKLRESGFVAPVSQVTVNGKPKSVLSQHGVSNLQSGEKHNDHHPTDTEPRMSISGAGSILSISFSGPGKQQVQSLFYHHMLSKNICLASRGFIALNICTKKEHLYTFVAALQEFINRYRNILV